MARRSIFTALILLAACLAQAAVMAGERPPNFVIIYIDDIRLYAELQ